MDERTEKLFWWFVQHWGREPYPEELAELVADKRRTGDEAHG